MTQRAGRDPNFQVGHQSPQELPAQVEYKAGGLEAEARSSGLGSATPSPETPGCSPLTSRAPATCKLGLVPVLTELLGRLSSQKARAD